MGYSMKPRVIDLREKDMRTARKIMKRLKKRNPVRPTKFLLPSYELKKRNNFEQDKLKSKCPYCGSRLVETSDGIVCSSENMRWIAMDIENSIRRWGDKAEMFMGTKAHRFFDYYKAEGHTMTCDYVMGNDERKYRIANVLKAPGVDRKKIFGAK